MKTIRLLLLALIIGLTPVACVTTAPPTHEAVVFYTFKDTWTTTSAIYTAYAELAVQGKVSARDQEDIDRAWNNFRASFKTAFKVATSDWSAATPDSVQKLADEVLTLIRALP